MVGAWYPILTDAIASALADGVRMEWKENQHVRMLSPDSLALVVAHFATKPRPRDEAPSMLTVSREIGNAIDYEAGKEGARALGAGLLGVASECGFIAPLEKRTRASSKRFDTVRVYLSAEAAAHRANIEARLAAADAIDKQGPTEVPPPLGVKHHAQH